MTGPARDRLVAAILDFLPHSGLLAFGEVRAALEREIDAAGSEALAGVKARLEEDRGWSYYPPDPLARRIHHLLADRFLQPASRVVGAEHLARLGAGPVAIFANHLSYADANVIEVLLRRADAPDVADRLTALAGPKVFTDRQRRFSSLCFGTLKVPQSAELSSEEAVMSAREVARAARLSIEAAHDRLRAGDALLLFGEGTRSRAAAMQHLLPGVARYLDVPGTRVLPIGLVGSEKLFPVADARISPAEVVMRVGAPIRAERFLDRARSDRRVIVDALGLAIAELLPRSYRGVYNEPGAFPEAWRILQSSTGVLE